jgi:tetratricopeptide (TPR) repeat protein
MSAGSATPSKSVQLSELSIPRLFFHLLRTRFTGELRLQQDEPTPGERSVWIKGGMPVFTDWINPPDNLGELLIARRVINRGQLDDALVQTKATGTPIGQVLLAAGALDAAKLSSALRLQCARKLLNAFRLREGKVEVIARENVEVSEDLQGQVNVLQLINRGIAAHYDEDRIRQEMGAAVDGKMTASKALTRYQAQFGFQREDAMLLRSLMRGASLDELAETQNRAHSAHIAFALWSCQMLRTADSTAKPSAPPAKAKSPAAPKPASGAVPAELSQPSPPNGALPPPPGVVANEDSGVPPPPGFDSRPHERPEESHENVVSRPRAPSAPVPKAATPPPLPSSANSGARRHQPAPSHRAEIVVDVQRKAELESELDSFEKLISADSNAFDLFGLDIEADRKAIRGRWADLSKRLHPDTLEAYGLSYLGPRMEAVFAAISEAYGVLSNKDERDRLRGMLKAGGTGKAGDDTSSLVKNALEADMLVRDGEKQVRGGRYKPALEFFEKADKLNPDDPSITASIAYCHFALTNHNSNDADAALEILEPLAAQHEKIARIHYYIGMVIVRSEGKKSRAHEAFQTAFNLDPRLLEAQRQLHALQVKSRQARKEKKKKKGFGGLFGR